jgi:hypothetical protein
MKTSHHNVENLSTSLKITITTPRPTVKIIQYSIMLVFLVFIAIFTLFIFSESGLLPFKTIIVLLSVYWEIWGLFYLLKLLIGREIIEASKDFITISTNLFGFSRTKKYPSEFIQDLKVLPNPYAHEYKTWSRSDVWWDKGDGLISLQFNAQNIRVGRWLDEAESQEIVDIIQKSFPQYHK